MKDGLKACKGCEGCADLSSMNKCGIFVYPTIMLDNKILECPCKTCLIKGICRMECESFIKYSNLCRESIKVNFRSFLPSVIESREKNVR